MSKKVNSPFSKQELLPQEECLEILKQKGELVIGIPKETHYQEKRVCLTPDAVGALTAHGHKFIIETGAGDGANYSDNEYSEAGAKISYDVKEAFGCQIVLKVEPPSIDEIKLINPILNERQNQFPRSCETTNNQSIYVNSVVTGVV